MQIPGFVWTAVLALIPLLIQWLSGEYFTGQAWVSLVIVVLGFVAKLVELYKPAEPAGFESAYAKPEPSRFARFMFGG